MISWLEDPGYRLERILLGLVAALPRGRRIFFDIFDSHFVNESAIQTSTHDASGPCLMEAITPCAYLVVLL